MAELLDGLLTLAREGDRVTDRERVQLTGVAEGAWQSVQTGDAVLRTAGTLSFRADANGLRRPFENLYRNAVEHGGDVES